MSDTAITFDVVRQRWDESLDSLNTLRDRLQSLAAAEERQAGLSETIEGATAVLQQTSDGLVSVTDLAREALTQLQSTLAAAEQLLNGTQLRDLQDEIKALRASSAAGFDSVRDTLTSKLVEIEAERDETKASRDMLRQRVDELEKAIATIPERQRNKLQQKYGLA